MVQLTNFVVAVAATASFVNAAPANGPLKRTEPLPKHHLEVRQAPPATATSTRGGFNTEYALLGAGLFSSLGGLIGGLIGSGMPKNTTFETSSIFAGLKSEYDTISTFFNSLSSIPGLAAGLGGGNNAAAGPGIASLLGGGAAAAAPTNLVTTAPYPGPYVTGSASTSTAAIAPLGTAAPSAHVPSPLEAQHGAPYANSSAVIPVGTPGPTAVSPAQLASSSSSSAVGSLSTGGAPPAAPAGHGGVAISATSAAPAHAHAPSSLTSSAIISTAASAGLPTPIAATPVAATTSSSAKPRNPYQRPGKGDN